MIVWSGPFGDLSGYSTAARDYVQAFYTHGLDIRTHIHNYDHRGHSVDFISEEQNSIISNLKIDDRTDFSDDIFVCHAAPNALYKVQGARKNILYTVWETSNCPDGLGEFLEQYDLILTPSEFSKLSLLNTYPDLNVKVLPHVIHDYSNVDLMYKHSALSGRTIYLWNGEWHIGKGYDIALKAFVNTFKDRDDIVLIIKTYNCSQTNYKQSVINYIKKIKGDNKYPYIIPVIGDISRDDLLSIYNSANFFIGTSRREGWGLTLSEAFGFNIPIICPDKGGHREFLDYSNSNLVKSTWSDVKGIETNRSLYKGQQWIECDQEDLESCLVEPKYCYQDDWDKTMNRFSEKEITKTFVELIEE